MPCYHPLRAWRSKDPQDYNPETGKYKMVFDSAKGLQSTETELPCGQCIGCRLDRARKWAIRCVHEASLYEDNCFITLTYDDFNYPENGSLNKRDFQLFMKRLRFKYEDARIRYFHCAEYGNDFQRPHHHACIFGFDFPDKYAWSIRKDYIIYRSDILESLWSFGFVSLGACNFDTACYVARYIMKKQNGPNADEHYQGRLPEFITMSRRPGIGREWFNKYKDDLYNYDKCVVRDNFILKPPRYYDNLYHEENPEHLAQIKRERLEKAKQNFDNDYNRLATREKCAKLKLDRYNRSLENS
jgi:hypothetical protein